MKYKLSLVLAIIVSSFYAQDTPGYEIPNFAAKTPEAAAFLKYGEYPVQLSTGVPEISIPIYTINTSGFSIPIALNYHASGIKVDQDATWVGLGWNLDFGAQIVLSVRDDVDENIGAVNTEPDLNYWDEHPYAFTSNYFTQYETSKVKDVYYLSSPTANGNFYIGSSGIVVYPPDEFKVSSIGDNNSFRVTDKFGNIYFFETKEVSYRENTHQDHYTSSWYVTKIQIPHKDIINFIYEDDGILEYKSISQRIVFDETVTNCDCPVEEYPMVITKTVSPLITDIGTTKTYAKKISEINFDNGNSKVVFIKTNGREDLKNGSTNSYLDRIEIKYKNSAGSFQILTAHEFVYSYFNPTASGPNAYKFKRLKLDRIENLLEDGDIHEFSYSAIPLPSKESFSKDYYGYYNDRANYTLIPRHYIAFPNLRPIGSADRRVNPDKNQCGMLTTIKYPTKGWTNFTYETNQYFGSDSFSRYNLLSVSCVSNGIAGTGSSNAQPWELQPGIDEDLYVCSDNNPNNCAQRCESSFTAINAQAVLNIHIVNVHELETTYARRYCRVSVYEENGDAVYVSSMQRTSLDAIIQLPLLNGNYKIVTEAWGDQMHIEANVSYFNDDNSTKNVYSSGLRIASIENFDHDGSIVSKKRYDYGDVINPSRTSGKVVNELIGEYSSNPFTSFDIGICPMPENVSGYLIKVDYVKTFSISSNSKYGIEGNAIVYEYVKEFQVGPNNDAMAGFTQYHFTTESDWVRIDVGITLNMPWKRGKLIEKKIYKTKGNNSYLLVEEINTYSDNIERIAYYKGFKILKRSVLDLNEYSNPLQEPLEIPLLMGCGVPVNVSAAFTPISYNIPIPWNFLRTTEIKEYFYNDANIETGQVINKTDYYYDSPLHQQPTRIVYTNPQGEERTVRTFYGPDVVAVSSLPGGNITASQFSAIQSLNQQNNIVLVQKEDSKSGQLLSRTRILYKDRNVPEAISSFGSPQYLQLVTQELVQSSKGNLDLENRVLYNLTDSRGNAVELQQYRGTKICYIWGYNKTKPIAKIENATINQIISALGVGSIDDIDESDITDIDALRNNTTFSNSMISTYVYEPLVGLVKMTDPKGHNTFFGYDTMGRLKEVKDNDGNLLSLNEYHYKL